MGTSKSVAHQECHVLRAIVPYPCFPGTQIEHGTHFSRGLDLSYTYWMKFLETIVKHSGTVMAGATDTRGRGHVTFNARGDRPLPSASPGGG
ncbi:hypothetical protein PoB_000757500 [Plakobranchus ocellatus]|uniref:Uncharacterized protein n=1 Tax=Plakobranchus ocellatus TaxID=259542 RepID=A0AAV3YEY3_9GAST|nr:hypothetical protein PoB_000757500 [Plakobranchus ocellatus]